MGIVIGVGLFSMGRRFDFQLLEFAMYRDGERQDRIFFFEAECSLIDFQK